MEYGLIGERLGHSFSKEIHERLMPVSYELAEIPRAKLDVFMRRRSFKAVNVTMPYKVDVLQYLDEVSERVRKTGACNSIVNRNGRLYGDNTDYCGFGDLLGKSGFDIRGCSVLVLGTGGTSRTVEAVLRDRGAADVIKAGRKGDARCISYGQCSLHTFDYIVNTTPVGMFPNENEVPVDIFKFSNIKGITDVVYNPLRTSLLIDALDAGIRGEGGLYMLVSQAIHAAALFYGIDFTARTNEVYDFLLEKKQNVVFIGMPGCGKSTIGRDFARKNGKMFIDTDSELEKISGMACGDFLRKYGESKFRELEREVVRKVSGYSGVVIATGGGVVLDCSNMRNLRHNGRILFIDRRLEELSPDVSRPLSDTKAKLAGIYSERHALYGKYADALWVV